MDNYTLMHHFELELEEECFHITCVDKRSLSQKGVSYSKSYAVFQELAALGVVSWRGKKLILDLFSKAKVTFLVRENQGLELSYRLDKWDTPCDFIAPTNPSWIIHGYYLKKIETDVSGNFLKNLPRKIDLSELHKLQKEGMEIHFSASSPLPLLQLTCATGAFACLSMDYGLHGVFSYAPSLEKPDFWRKLEEEKYWEKDLLQTGFIKKKVNTADYYCPLDQVGKSLAFLLEMGWNIADYRGKKLILESKRAISAHKEGGKVHIQGKLIFDQYSADLKQVAGAFIKKERFLDLSENSVGLLQQEDSLIPLLLEAESVSEKIVLKSHQLGLIDYQNHSWEISLDIARLFHPMEKQVLPSFQGSLRPYQQRGYQWISSLYAEGFHGILADEMGLGKTVQVIAFLAEHLDENHLIIVPKSLLFNWEQEIKRFLPEMPVFCHHGKDREAQLPCKGVCLTSYHTLRNDESLFQNRKWHTIVLDEGQLIKNCEGQLAKSIYPLEGKFRLILSGTLIENHAKELWSYFHFLMPGMLEQKEIFERELHLSQIDSRYVKKIQKMIRPFMLRRKKEEVALDLPSLDEQVVYVEMEDQQRRLYDTFLASAKKGMVKKNYLSNNSKGNIEIFEIILRLRQIACSPLLIGESGSSGKWEALFLDIENVVNEGKKALVFSQFASMLHLIAKELNHRHIPFVLLEGATENREEVVRQFQEDATVPIFLMTLKAGGVGLNLTAADYVFIYDPWWHEAQEAQAIARAHRIGQKKAVIAKRYITLESVEAKMMTLKKAKKDLFTQLTEGELNSELFNQLG